jgi:hypothetical protein
MGSAYCPSFMERLNDLLSLILNGCISAKYKSSNELDPPVPLRESSSEALLAITHAVCITTDGGRSWVLFVEMGSSEFT